jgi:hypothetical protein
MMHHSYGAATTNHWPGKPTGILTLVGDSNRELNGDALPRILETVNPNLLDWACNLAS